MLVVVCPQLSLAVRLFSEGKDTLDAALRELLLTFAIERRPKLADNLCTAAGRMNMILMFIKFAISDCQAKTASCLISRSYYFGRTSRHFSLWWTVILCDVGGCLVWVWTYRSFSLITSLELAWCLYEYFHKQGGCSYLPLPYACLEPLHMPPVCDFSTD